MKSNIIEAVCLICGSKLTREDLEDGRIQEIDGGRACIKHDVRSGQSTTERCPKCGNFLLKNFFGNRWCSSISCNYHIRKENYITKVA